MTARELGDKRVVVQTRVTSMLAWQATITQASMSAPAGYELQPASPELQALFPLQVCVVQIFPLSSVPCYLQRRCASTWALRIVHSVALLLFILLSQDLGMTESGLHLQSASVHSRMTPPCISAGEHEATMQASVGICQTLANYSRVRHCCVQTVQFHLFLCSPIFDPCKCRWNQAPQCCCCTS